jgi:hypothetical protein
MLWARACARRYVVVKKSWSVVIEFGFLASRERRLARFVNILAFAREKMYIRSGNLAKQASTHVAGEPTEQSLTVR